VDILDEFDRMGARFDDHLFEVAEKGLDTARKLFKSAQVSMCI